MPLYKRKNSSHYWLKFKIDGRTFRLSTGTADKQAAREFEATARGNAWRQTKLDERPPYAWVTARKRWMADTQQRTKAKNEEILAWFDEHLKDAMLTEITRGVEKLRELRAEESSPATADRYMCCLRAILRKAVNDWQVLDSAPKVPMYRPRAAEPRFLSRAEFDRLAEELPPHLKVAARFAAFTGLRMRSMLSLEWGRIDMDTKRAWIPGEQMKAGRSHGLPLSNDAIAVLKELRKLSPEGERVFQYRDGLGVSHPVDDCNTAAFQKAAKRAKLDPLRWHDLRHAWASWAVRNGVTLHELMQLGGGPATAWS